VSEPIVDLLEAEWRALSDLCATLDEAAWALPTDLPGWSVKDNISHIVGTERQLRGEAPPAVDVSHLGHLRNPLGEVNELWIEARRDRPGAEVLAELDAVTHERIAELRALPPERFDEVGWTPAGQAPYREFMKIRVFDSWMHEQDIRRAIGRPGHTSGPVAEHALDRCQLAMGFAVGKQAAAPDGASVVFSLTGGAPRRFGVVVEGRARVVTPDDLSNDLPSDPTVRLTMDAETFWCLGGGRWDPDTAMADGRVGIDGDPALGERVVRSLNFMI